MRIRPARSVTSARGDVLPAIGGSQAIAQGDSSRSATKVARALPTVAFDNVGRLSAAGVWATGEAERGAGYEVFETVKLRAHDGCTFSHTG